MGGGMKDVEKEQKAQPGDPPGGECPGGSQLRDPHDGSGVPGDQRPGEPTEHRLPDRGLPGCGKLRRKACKALKIKELSNLNKHICYEFEIS